MITLPLVVDDLNNLRALHDKHFSGEFAFPDFAKFTNPFKILDRDGKLVVAGGVKMFPEIILITDLEASPSNRALALTSAMQISTLIASQYGNLFCSAPKDSKWDRQVRSVGFVDSRDHNLVLSL